MLENGEWLLQLDELAGEQMVAYPKLRPCLCFVRAGQRRKSERTSCDRSSCPIEAPAFDAAVPTVPVSRVPWSSMSSGCRDDGSTTKEEVEAVGVGGRLTVRGSSMVCERVSRHP